MFSDDGRSEAGASSIALPRRRGKAPDIGGGILAKRRKCDDDQANQTLDFLAADGEKYADAVAVGNSLPASLRKRLRFFCVGAGRVAHSCCLCNVQMNEVDPTLGPEFYILWANLDADGISVGGYVDQYCKGTMTRRYPGWTLKEVKAHRRLAKRRTSRNLSLCRMGNVRS